MAVDFFGPQFKEMGGSSISRSRAIADEAKPSEQQNERKKIFPDWRNLMKPMNEEKDHWVIDLSVSGYQLYKKNSTCEGLVIKSFQTHNFCIVFKARFKFSSVPNLLLL
jgi:hypothetical protein